MSWSYAYDTRNVALGSDYIYLFTASADYKITFTQLFSDLGVVQLVDGLIPVGLLPEGLGGGSGNGDFVGPSGATDGLPVLFDGPTGKVGKAGTAAQLVPTSGAAAGKFLGFTTEPVWLDNSLTIGDGTLALSKLVNIEPARIMGRKAADGSGPMLPLTEVEVLEVLGVEAGATANPSSAALIAQLTSDVGSDDDVATALSELVLTAVLRHLAIDPATVRANFTTAGLVYSEGTFTTLQALMGAADSTTAVQGADLINGTPSVAGIIAGATGMVATAEILTSVWRPRQATLATGSLTFDASTGLQWTVAAGANNITVEESCWANIPLDKPATLEIVAGASARTITFADTSTNLKVDTAGSPWNSTSSGTRVRFELSWAAEGSAPTVKSKRVAVFLGYAP